MCSLQRFLCCMELEKGAIALGWCVIKNINILLISQLSKNLNFYLQVFVHQKLYHNDIFLWCDCRSNDNRLHSHIKNIAVCSCF